MRWETERGGGARGVPSSGFRVPGSEILTGTFRTSHANHGTRGAMKFNAGAGEASQARMLVDGFGVDC